MTNRIITIFGPTASSKSRIAIEVALKFNGEIINSDSRQFYKYMEIGTASPTQQEKSLVSHHLYNILMPDNPINAGTYIKMADEKIKEIRNKNKIPIVVGGTGLYLKSLIKGIVEIPQIPQQIRENIKNMIKEIGLSKCYEYLKKLDIEYALKISPTDKQRIERALEVITYTNEKFSSFHKNHRFEKDRYEYISIKIMPERDILYKRINKRTEEIFKNGIIEETEFLIENGYKETLAFNAIGYFEAYQFLSSEISLIEAIEKTALRTRQYAKRQITWFKKSDGRVFSGIEDIDEIFKYISLCI